MFDQPKVKEPEKRGCLSASGGRSPLISSTISSREREGGRPLSLSLSLSLTLPYGTKLAPPLPYGLISGFRVALDLLPLLLLLLPFLPLLILGGREEKESREKESLMRGLETRGDEEAEEEEDSGGEDSTEEEEEEEEDEDVKEKSPE